MMRCRVEVFTIGEALVFDFGNFAIVATHVNRSALQDAQLETFIRPHEMASFWLYYRKEVEAAEVFLAHRDYCRFLSLINQHNLPHLWELVIAYFAHQVASFANA